MTRRFFSVLLLFALIVGCGPADHATDSSDSAARPSATTPYQVVATTGMVADIVRQVVGERGEVQGIIGEGVDPHLYKPTRSDIALLLEADIIFYSGLMLEGKMADTLIKVGRSKPVHAVTEEIPTEYLIQPDDTEGYADPHVWMDVSAWQRAVSVIGEALAAFDPDSRELYEKNAAAYNETLSRLHDYATTSIESIPEEKRMLVTAHDAFGYFGRAYDLEVRGIQGLSTESEAGLEDINRLVDLLVERGIEAVFVESSVAEKNVRALVEGARSRGAEVSIGGELFSDAMGEPGSYRGTYVGMIDHNVTTITRALGGQAPEGGMQDKL